MTDSHPFDTLTPDFLIDAVESQGWCCDGRLLALNSYENRVYQVGIEDDLPLIAKFYRPQRWSDAQIQEEHDFCAELVEHELPVVPPLRNAQGETLLAFGAFRFALFPRQGGHAPELDHLDNLRVLGRFLGRLHAVGASRAFRARPALTSQSHGHESVALVSEHFIPAELQQAYSSLGQDLLRLIEDILAQCGPLRLIRTHGDCHVGNILWREERPHFVDLDDARMAPAIQDLWMLLCGEPERQRLQLKAIVEGYNEFYEFRPQELRLIEVLRTLRMLHYAAWLARRWEDPAFPKAFPWFNSVRYWSEHILELREQFAALQEPPLALY